MANSDKDILITPNNDAAGLPEISFVGFDNAPIKLQVEDNNSVSFISGSNQLYNIDSNATSGNIFTVSDTTGIPTIAYNVDGTVQLSPYIGKVALGGTSAISKLQVYKDPNDTAGPSITLPDNTDPRYSVGLGSTYVENVGQRLDFFAGDSTDNTTNLGSTHLKMSLTAEGNLGLATNNPGSMVDIRPIVYSNNQNSNGYQLGTTGGQWIAKFSIRSNDGGTPFISIETPADAEGNTVEAFQVQGQNAGFVRLRPGGDDIIFNASSERVGINKDISTGNDGRSVLEIDGGLRIRNTQGGETPSKPGHIGLWDFNIDANWKWNSGSQYDSMFAQGVYRNYAYVDYKPLTTWRSNYLHYNQLEIRDNNIDNPSLNSLRLGPKMHNKEYTISSITPGNGQIDNNTGVATSGTPAVIVLSEDISRIYGPFTITNITGWPTTAPTPDGNGNYSTVDIYLTLANNANGEAHDIEYGTGLYLSGIGGGLDGPIDVFRIQGDRRIRVRKNLSSWTGAPTTNGGSLRARWIRTVIRDAGTSTAQSVGWNWIRNYRFKTDAANPARTLTTGGNFSGYQTVSSGYVRIYRDYTDNAYMVRNQVNIGAGNQTMGFTNYAPSHTCFNYTRKGNNSTLTQMAASWTNVNQSYRGHSYNLYGAYVSNNRGMDMYVRNYRNGRVNYNWGYYSEIRNGLYTDSNGYSAYDWGFYSYITPRGTSRTNDARGAYFYVRAGDNSTNHRPLINTAHGCRVRVRSDGGTINTGYLYFGEFQTGSNNGTTTESIITTKRGIWLTGCTDSRIDGNLELNGEAATLKVNRVSCFTDGQELILCAGESLAQIGGIIPTPGGEYVYVAGESGLLVYSSNNNWGASGGTSLLRTATYCDSNGNASLPGTLSEGSDIRLKTNIRNIPDALSKVMSLRGTIFNRLDKDDKEEIGLIAQEVEQVLPQVVEETDYTWEGDKMKSIGYGKIVGLLIEAMKEQQAQIEDLKARLG